MKIDLSRIVMTRNEFLYKKHFSIVYGKKEPYALKSETQTFGLNAREGTWGINLTPWPFFFYNP